MESYKHKAAKEVLYGWLTELDSSVPYEGACGIRWVSNRSAPYGVWQECPIYCQDQYSWDEEPWQEALGVPEETIIPTYEQCLKYGTPPKIIVDVMLQHKGLLSLGFEVVHKNPISKEKAKIIEELGIAVMEIPAEWVLSQVEKPSKLGATRIIGDPGRFIQDYKQLRGWSYA